MPNPFQKQADDTRSLFDRLRYAIQNEGFADRAAIVAYTELTFLKDLPESQVVLTTKIDGIPILSRKIKLNAYFKDGLKSIRKSIIDDSLTQSQCNLLIGEIIKTDTSLEDKKSELEDSTHHYTHWDDFTPWYATYNKKSGVLLRFLDIVRQKIVSTYRESLELNQFLRDFVKKIELSGISLIQMAMIWDQINQKNAGIFKKHHYMRVFVAIFSLVDKSNEDLSYSIPDVLDHLLDPSLDRRDFYDIMDDTLALEQEILKTIQFPQREEVRKYIRIHVDESAMKRLHEPDLEQEKKEKDLKNRYYDEYSKLAMAKINPNLSDVNYLKLTNEKYENLCVRLKKITNFKSVRETELIISIMKSINDFNFFEIINYLRMVDQLQSKRYQRLKYYIFEAYRKCHPGVSLISLISPQIKSLRAIQKELVLKVIYFHSENNQQQFNLNLYKLLCENPEMYYQILKDVLKKDATSLSFYKKLEKTKIIKKDLPAVLQVMASISDFDPNKIFEYSDNLKKLSAYPELVKSAKAFYLKIHWIERYQSFIFASDIPVACRKLHLEYHNSLNNNESNNVLLALAPRHPAVVDDMVMLMRKQEELMLGNLTDVEKLDAALNTLQVILKNKQVKPELCKAAVQIYQAMNEIKKNINSNDLPLATEIVTCTIRSMINPGYPNNMLNIRSLANRIPQTSLDKQCITSALQAFLHVLYMVGRSVAAMVGVTYGPDSYQPSKQKTRIASTLTTFFAVLERTKNQTKATKPGEEKEYKNKI